ncbi:hypothetical protein B9Z19DRAFT_1071671 [Tuber borchii]|uniref:Uncharacterized protein n=1 Tax=Tuber borchii TaxID=42251 RepID=A0A2T7A7X0_TUBBO|nr:hypothetical protein B9Z19DRAFT_1071671 [Tuber borchii]
MSSQDTTQAVTAAPSSGQEPLLGRPVDLVASVWVAVFTHRILIPFSLHPLLDSLDILFALEAILRRKGTYVHAGFVILAALCFYGALAAILVQKKRAGSALSYVSSLFSGMLFSRFIVSHFELSHDILGVIIYSVLLVQAFIEFAQYFVPGLYGGVDNAKAVYKYHRLSGYLLLTRFLVTVSLVCFTFYGGRALNLKLWSVALVGVVFPPIKK